MALLKHSLKRLLLFGIIHWSSAVFPPYVGNGLPNTFQRNDIINHYFSLDLAYSEILAFLLCFHGIEISLRQLKRVLRRQGLHRRKDHSDIKEILNAIETELEGSGNSIGYRQMHQRLRIYYGLVVQKETVRVIIRELDPASVQSRSSKRLILRRREYRGKGPNYMAHGWLRQAQTIWVLHTWGYRWLLFYFTLLYFNHFLNKLNIYTKLRGRPRNRKGFPYKRPPKKEKQYTYLYIFVII